MEIEAFNKASICTRFLFAGAVLGAWGASVKGRKRRTREAPVKNGASFNDC